MVQIGPIVLKLFAKWRSDVNFGTGYRLNVCPGNYLAEMFCWSNHTKPVTLRPTDCSCTGV